LTPCRQKYYYNSIKFKKAVLSALDRQHETNIKERKILSGVGEMPIIAISGAG